MDTASVHTSLAELEAELAEQARRDKAENAEWDALCQWIRRRLGPKHALPSSLTVPAIARRLQQRTVPPGSTPVTGTSLRKYIVRQPVESYHFFLSLVANEPTARLLCNGASVQKAGSGVPKKCASATAAAVDAPADASVANHPGPERHQAGSSADSDGEAAPIMMEVDSRVSE